MGSGGSKKEENKQTTPTKTPTTTATTTTKSSVIKNENDNRNSSLQKQKSTNEIQYPNNNRTQFDNNQTLQNNNVPKSTPQSQWNKKDDIDDVLNLDSEWSSKNRREDVYPTPRSDRGGNRRDEERNAYNRQMNTSTVIEEYPETYAQRNARQQYKRNDLLRQKTIYRDPKEWEPESEEKPAEEDQGDSGEFDISKFKAANKTAPPPRRDIFDMTPDPYTSRQSYDDFNDPDSYYEQGRQPIPKHAPTYDKTEEDLMADIEKIF